MGCRKLGRTGLIVPEVGLGTWPLSGNRYFPGYGKGHTELARGVLKAAVQGGVEFLDTALAYDAGHINRTIGNLFPAGSDNITICTKGGWDLDQGAFNPDPSFLRNQVINNLTTLQRDCLDIFLLHSPPAEFIAEPRIYGPLLELREQGKIKAIGVSVRHFEDAWQVLLAPEIDVVQLPYNPVLWGKDRGLIAALGKQDIGIIAREILVNGTLAKTNDFYPIDDFRAHWPLELHQQVFTAKADWESYRRGHESWLEFALRFALDRSEICTALVGARKREHIDDLCKAVSRETRIENQ